VIDNRPSKKQRELLSFIDSFIKGNGYGPSYREVMRALDYKSVSTVATHVNGLIARGYLRKKDNSARSLEVMSPGAILTTHTQPGGHEEWLHDLVIKQLEHLKQEEGSVGVQDSEVLLEAMSLLGFEHEAERLRARFLDQ
jgi:repressor LexA